MLPPFCPFSVQLQGKGLGQLPRSCPRHSMSTKAAGKGAQAHCTPSTKAARKGTSAHCTPSTLQHHGQPSALFSVQQLWLTCRQTPHLSVLLWRIKGNYQFLLPLKEYISLLSLTASDNEGQFRNHIKTQQLQLALLFNFNISTCVSKEMRRRKGTTQGMGFFFSLQGVEDFHTELWPSPNLSFIWAAEGGTHHHLLADREGLTPLCWCSHCALRESSGDAGPWASRAGSTANLIRGDISYSNTDSPRTAHTFLHEQQYTLMN